MRRQVCFGAMILVIMLLTLSCGKTYYSYVPTAEYTRMVYMEKEDILNLETVAARLYDKQVYVEVTTRDGKKRTGKLIRIDGGDLMMTPSYYYDTVDESMVRVDVEEVIPKDQILVLKVF